MKSIYQVTILIDGKNISVYLCETCFCGRFQFPFHPQLYHIHLAIYSLSRLTERKACARTHK